MSKTEIQIILSIIPVVIYIGTWLWTRRLISSKLTNKGDRKKYNKYFNKRLGEFFAPIFLFFVIISFSIFPQDNQFVGRELVLYILRLILLIVQAAYSILVFLTFKKLIKNLRNGNTTDILNDIETD